MNELTLIKNEAILVKEAQIQELVYQTKNNYFREEEQAKAQEYAEEINKL